MTVAQRTRTAEEERERPVTAGLVPVLAVVAVVVCLAVQWAVTAVPLPVSTQVPEALTTWTVVAGAVVLGALVLVGRVPGWLRAVLVVAVLTTVATAVFAWPLHETRYYFGGLWSDQQFRTQYLTRTASSASLSDMNYADLPPFYPAGWFWPAGRIADLTGMAPWAAYKPLALATVGMTPALVWVVWTRIVGWRGAVGVGVVTLVASVSLAATEPYSWPSVALLPAAAVVFWRQVSSVHPRHGSLLTIGLFLGATAAVYTLYALAGALLVVLLAGLAVVLAGEQRWTVLRRAVGCLVVAATPAVLAALVVWAPYLLEALSSGTGENVAARFLPLVSAELPAVLQGDPWGLLLAAGLVAVLARLGMAWGRRPDVFLALLVTAALAYGWYGASTLALVLGTTLLGFRFESLVVLVLATAGVLALSDLAPRLRDALAVRGWQPAGVGVAAVALVAIGLTQVVTHRLDLLDERVDLAYETPYPDGPNARAAVDEAREEGWSDALAGEIDQRTGTPAEDTVVLTASYSLLSYHPYLGFQSLTPHYANPLSDYEERTDYIARLADSRTPAELVSLLDDCPWAAPTAFVLRRADDGLHVPLGSDAFPASPNIAFTDVVFDPGLFSGPQFETADVGPFVVAVRQG